MIKKIAFLLYPTAKVRPDEDSSFWIMHELKKRGFEVTHFESRDMTASKDSVLARLSVSDLDPKRGFINTKTSAEQSDLSKLHAIFIRKEPPFDNEYLYCLQLLHLLRNKTFIANDPAGIALYNEKLSILRYPSYTPDTHVTQSAADAKLWIKRLGKKVVLKPLDNKAGSGIVITHKNDKNLSSLLDLLSAFSTRRFMIQAFIPAKHGLDKRILFLNGEPIGSFARKPAPGDYRSNLSVGGSMHRCSLTQKDIKLARAIGPDLRKNGIYFAGIDAMDGRLTEINVTSPSGIPEIKSLYGKSLEIDVADFIEEKLA